MLRKPIVYSASQDTFNLNRTLLKPIKTLLENCSTTPVNILCIGDSTTEGGNATNFVDDRWTEKLQRGLQSAFNYGNGGVGWLNTVSSFGYGSSTCQWSGSGSLGGGVRNFGNRTMAWATNAAVTLTYTGTSFKAQYLLGTSSFTVAVDGGAPVTVNPAAGTTNQGAYSAPVLTNGSHTAVFTPTVGQTVPVTGAIIYNGDETTGVQVFEDALYGQTTTSALAGWCSSTGLIDPLSANFCPNPALVTIQFGLNDDHNGISTATYKSNIQSIISNVQSLCSNTPIFIVCGQWNAGAYAPDGRAFSDAAQQIATADPTHVVYTDFFSTITAGYSTLDNDSIHPNNAGEVAIANQLLSLFTFAGPSFSDVSIKPHPFQPGTAR